MNVLFCAQLNQVNFILLRVPSFCDDFAQVVAIPTFCCSSSLSLISHSIEIWSNMVAVIWHYNLHVHDRVECGMGIVVLPSNHREQRMLAD